MDKNTITGHTTILPSQQDKTLLTTTYNNSTVDSDTSTAQKKDAERSSQTHDSSHSFRPAFSGGKQ